MQRAACQRGCRSPILRDCAAAPRPTALGQLERSAERAAHWLKAGARRGSAPGGSRDPHSTCGECADPEQAPSAAGRKALVRHSGPLLELPAAAESVVMHGVQWSLWALAPAQNRTSRTPGEPRRVPTARTSSARPRPSCCSAPRRRCSLGLWGDLEVQRVRTSTRPGRRSRTTAVSPRSVRRLRYRGGAAPTSTWIHWLRAVPSLSRTSASTSILENYEIRRPRGLAGIETTSPHEQSSQDSPASSAAIIYSARIRE